MRAMDDNRADKAATRIKQLHPWISLSRQDIKALKQVEDDMDEANAEASAYDGAWGIVLMLLVYAGAISLVLYWVLNFIVGEWHGPD